jgi:hypothetical protein
VAQAEQAGRVTDDEREEAATGAHHRFRLASDMPLNEANAAVRVHFLECWATLKGNIQHFSWVTDLRVNKGTVYRLMQGGRARWRIENETFNTLNNQGYPFEHNVGHGYQHLSVVFAVLMLLAFLVDQVQQLCCPLFQAAWAQWGSKRLLWEKMRAWFYDDALESMQQLCEALFYGVKKSAPLLNFDSSSGASRLQQWGRSKTNRTSSPTRVELRLGQDQNLLGAQCSYPFDSTWSFKSDKWDIKLPSKISPT